MRLVACPFDSEHYGLAIGRLVREAGDGPAELAAAITAARRERYAVVFVRLAGDDPLRGALAAAGHAPVDTLVTSMLAARSALPRSPEPAPELAPELTIEHHDRLADPADVAAVAAISGEAIRTSHLHADPRLPAERTRALYAAWATNDVTGRAQRTIVARAGRELIGYLAVVATPGTAMIDLVAVAAAWRGRGAGASLLAGFIDWLGDRAGDPSLVATVGTQADNPALRLYARCGFVPTATHVTYHLWLDG
ncbi:MAG TPA: GNAT family N-acetyltransferase [Kofleriaceae bacterium]|jgi:GNAT superfamily N-acetyltransferase|nr:GNAT family N-acetyltransferase [Kofleriaceae bacterium]